jgi:hypothetical protein
MAERQLVWQTRTWLISFTLELDVASGTGRKSRIAEVDVSKLRRFLEYPLSLPGDMRTVCIIELHQLRGRPINYIFVFWKMVNQKQAITALLLTT